mgnify:CR=1 FL=1
MILQWPYLKWVAAASIVLFVGIALFNTHQKANTLAFSSLSNDEIALYLQEHEWVSQSEAIETYNLEQISETTLDELLTIGILLAISGSFASTVSKAEETLSTIGVLVVEEVALSIPSRSILFDIIKLVAMIAINKITAIFLLN